MKTLITLSLLTVSLLVSAKGIKINVKEEIRPYTIKIEKIENQNGKTLVYGKIKQQKRFSYSVEFADCAIITTSKPEGIKGELFNWNEDKKIPFTVKPVRDNKDEEFVLAFPENSIPQAGSFDLKLGTIQNREKSELIIKNLTLQKKK